MKTNSTKTTAQLKALQTQVQALSPTLNKEVAVVVTKTLGSCTSNAYW